MKKSDFTFIFGLTLLAGVIWVAGELVMGICIAVYSWVPVAWRILVIAVTLIVSVWHSFKNEDFSDSESVKKK